MNPIEAVISGFKQYANFKGRARRSEYWYWTLFVTSISAVYYIWCLALLSIRRMIGINLVPFFSVIYTLFFLALIVPCLSVCIRRLHDTGRSGWWYLLILVPFASIAIIVFFCQDSQPGRNQWGANPKMIQGSYNPNSDFPTRNNQFAVKVCPSCNHRIDEDSLFCPYCGSSIPREPVDEIFNKGYEMSSLFTEQENHNKIKEVQTVECPECHTLYEDNIPLFCPVCGKALDH